MSTRRPLIAVTCPDRGGRVSWWCLRLLLWQAGARVVRICPSRPRQIDDCSALILGGGADIDPLRYHEKLVAAMQEQASSHRRKKKHLLTGAVLWLLRRLMSVSFTTVREDKARDDLEFRILKRAVRRKMPVLGICRGAQVINVFFGGTLYQNLNEFYVETPQLHTVLAKKTVHVEHDSHLGRVLRNHHMKVNSLHHQSVKALGEGLRVVGTENNGVVQAIEASGPEWIVGVQWHPEFLPLHRPQRRIFRAFVNEAREFSVATRSHTPRRTSELHHRAH